MKKRHEIEDGIYVLAVGDHKNSELWLSRMTKRRDRMRWYKPGGRMALLHARVGTDISYSGVLTAVATNSSDF